MIAATIIACEIGFWLLLGAGLAARYRLGWPGLGLALLAATPLVDLVLLVVTTLDLRGGATAGTVHALAAVYIGISVGFGQRMIAWADARFAHRFAGGPPPRRAPRRGPEHAAHERRGWYRHLLAWAVGCTLLLAAIALVGDAARTEAMRQMIGVWSVVLAIDFIWSFSYTLWPRRGDPESA